MIVPKQSNRAPPLLPTDQISSPIHLSSRARVFGRLLCDSAATLRPRHNQFSIFIPLQFAARHKKTTPPTDSALVASPLHPIPQRRRQLLFDCCVPQLNGSHLRPRVRPSLNLFCHQYAAPSKGQPSSPHVLPQPCLPSITLPNVETICHLIVVFPHRLAAT